MFEVAIITASDKGAKGLREDLSGPCIKQIVEESDYKVVSMEILPDDRALLADKMIELADKEIPLILTTGGTGFSPRDNTPEATKDVIEKETLGISEAMRMYSLKITPRAMLSDAINCCSATCISWQLHTFIVSDHAKKSGKIYKKTPAV